RRRPRPGERLGRAGGGAVLLAVHHPRLRRRDLVRRDARDGGPPAAAGGSALGAVDAELPVRLRGGAGLPPLGRRAAAGAPARGAGPPAPGRSTERGSGTGAHLSAATFPFDRHPRACPEGPFLSRMTAVSEAARVQLRSPQFSR